MKIAVVTCYDQADTHTRPRILRACFAAVPGVEVVVIKNKHQGLLRYFEVPLRVLKARFMHHFDAYVLTFRGYEMLPFMLLAKGRKPLVFDELVNAVEYLREHNKLMSNSRPDRVARSVYGWLLRRCRFVVADTDAHADLSASLCAVARSHYVTLPVSADETVFYPRQIAKKQGFNVFFYGVMTKLHGLQYVLDAAVALCKEYPDITFTLGGDSGKADALYAAAIAKGARITTKPYYSLREISQHAHRANLCIGGPFGDTPQAQLVITTKTFQFIACERPVLIGRNKVNAAFKDKANSLVVPQGDSKAIYDAIAWAYEHPKELHRIAQAGRQLYEAEFSQAAIAKQVQSLVEQL